VNYTVKDWTLFYGLEWVGKTSNYDAFGDNPATSFFKRSTSDYYLQSASVTYRNTVGNWRATFGVRNLANVTPPTVSSQSGVNRVGNSPLYSGYDYQGRRLFLNVSKTF
jgi:iron complex outermembrane recepter protein